MNMECSLRAVAVRAGLPPLPYKRKGMKRHWLLFLCMLFLGGGRANAQLLALKTDVLLDGMMTPNLNVEMVVGGKTSINATLFGNHRPWGKELKMIGVMPELRYWFNGRPLTREFVGVSALGAAYDITWGSERYKGDAAGVGLTFGYAFFLGKHWTLECHAGLGAVYYTHRFSYVNDLYLHSEHNEHGYSLIPYKLGISFVYIIR